MVLLVLGEREGGGRVSCQFCGGHARNENWDDARILIEGCSVANMKFIRFPLHHHGIKQREVSNKDQSRNPRARGNPCPKGQNGAAQIKRIPSVSVGPRYAEDFLLMKVARCISAQAQSGDTNQGADQNAARRGAREINNCYRKWITDANTPANEKTASRAHRRAST